VKQILTLKRKHVTHSFTLEFDTAEDAEKAAAVLEEDGFAVERRAGRILVATRGVRSDSVDATELVLRELAERYGGVYKGAA
jgi:hypothetical protein